MPRGFKILGSRMQDAGTRDLLDAVILNGDRTTLMESALRFVCLASHLANQVWGPELLASHVE
jgi:hypothetical protein